MAQSALEVLKKLPFPDHTRAVLVVVGSAKVDVSRAEGLDLKSVGVQVDRSWGNFGQALMRGRRANLSAKRNTSKEAIQVHAWEVLTKLDELTNKLP